jgi:hypothetical protein
VRALLRMARRQAYVSAGQHSRASCSQERTHNE